MRLDRRSLAAAPDGIGSLHSLLQQTDPMRREGTGEVRVSARGLKTRAALLNSARALFSDAGYQATSVASIAAAAGTSLGTFYQYFSDRAVILTALVAQEVADLLADNSRVWHVEQGPAGLRPFLLSYVTATVQNASFWRVWEEVTHTEGGLADVRRDLVRLLNASVAKQIRRGQQLGLVNPNLDSVLTAAALTSMVDRYIYVTYVFAPPAQLPSHEHSAEVLAQIWSQSVFGSGLL
jgi:AcrR family transcriptional regulator